MRRHTTAASPKAALLLMLGVLIFVTEPASSQLNQTCNATSLKNSNASANCTTSNNATDAASSSAGTLFASTDTTTPQTTGAATSSPDTTTAPPTSTAAPTPAPPTPVPPTPVPTGGSWTEPPTIAPSTVVTTTVSPTTTVAPTSAPPACDASPFRCAMKGPRASCSLVTQAAIVALPCQCAEESLRLPVVSIAFDQSLITLPADDDLRLTAQAFHSWCPAGGDPFWSAYSITWTIKTQSNTVVTPAGSVLSGPALYIPAGKLPAGSTFTIVATATVSSTLITVRGSTNVTVSSAAPTPTVAIVGGDRIVSASQPLNIVAQIDDVFLQQNAVKWSCCSVASAAAATCAGFCSPPLDSLPLFTSSTLTLAAPQGSFKPETVRLFATYANVVATVTLTIVNASVPTVYLFVPTSQSLCRADQPVLVSASWSKDGSSAEGLSALWLINGSEPLAGKVSYNGDRSAMTIAPGSFNPGVLLAITVQLVTSTSKVVASTNAVVTLVGVPVTGTCTVTPGAPAQPVSTMTVMTITATGWRGTPAFSNLLLRAGYTDGDEVHYLSGSEVLFDGDSGACSATFTAPLIDAFVSAQQRSATVTFVAEVLDASSGTVLGRSTCGATVYSYALSVGLPQLAAGLVSSLSQPSSQLDLFSTVTAVRNLAVIAASMKNASQADFINTGLAALDRSLAAAPVASLPSSARIACLRLCLFAMSTFSSAIPGARAGIVSASWLPALLQRFFAAQATVAAPQLANSTALLAVQAMQLLLIPLASDLSSQAALQAFLLSSDTAQVIVDAAFRLPLLASTTVDAWNGIASVSTFAALIAAKNAIPYQMSSFAGTGGSGAIQATKVYQYGSLPAMAAMDVTFVPPAGQAAVDAFVWPTTEVNVRMSLTVANCSAMSNSGVALQQFLSWSATSSTGTIGRHQVLSSVAVINVTTDESPSAVGARSSSIGSLRFPKASTLARAAGARPDVSALGNITLLVAAMQCVYRTMPGAVMYAPVNDDGATLSCDVVALNVAVAITAFRPGFLDAVVIVTTAAPPVTVLTTPAPPVVGDTSSNALASLTIVLATLGSMLLVALIIVAALLVMKIQNQKARDAKITAVDAQPTPLLRAPSTSVQRSMATPLNRAKSAPTDSDDDSVAAFTINHMSPIKLTDAHQSRVGTTVGERDLENLLFRDTRCPLPPRIMIDDELHIVPRRRPDSVRHDTTAMMVDDPTPWL